MMDLRSTFGFHQTPFTREIRPEDLWPLPFFDDALAGLVRAVEGRMSCALIAPAGTGKTALLRRLHAQLPEARYHVRYVKVTDLGKWDLCRELATACDASAKGSYPMLVRRIQDRCEQTYQTDGRRPVILLDEAQDMRPDVLGLLRILTNYEMDSRLVLSLVLAGKPTLKKLLDRDDQEAIARRLVHYATLRLLSRDETVSYLAHRCTIAGRAQLPFDEGALDALYEIGRGNLRATDALALKSLERAALAGHQAIAAHHVAAARKDLWP